MKIKDLNKIQILKLLEDAAKLWLAEDGLWFLEVEKAFGMDTAIKLDKLVWEKFSPLEAKKIMQRFKIKENGGISALKQALKFRLYAHINKQEIIKVTDKKIILRMNTCRVQEARERKNLPLFPCKEVGLIEYTYFAKTIDPKIQTKCLTCPPDGRAPQHWCAWEFEEKN
ncbi:MAG: hypothetical protein HYU63_09450 [Armatimonadetes bacterium]|nr:hypothetical protein [Armatimonadota bacterium]